MRKFNLRNGLVMSFKIRISSFIFLVASQHTRFELEMTEYSICVYSLKSWRQFCTVLLFLCTLKGKVNKFFESILHTTQHPAPKSKCLLFFCSVIECTILTLGPKLPRKLGFYYARKQHLCNTAVSKVKLKMG